MDKMEVLQIFDAFDGVGNLHNTLHEGHLEADVLCPEVVREKLFVKDSQEPRAMPLTPESSLSLKKATHQGHSESQPPHLSVCQPQRTGF